MLRKLKMIEAIVFSQQQYVKVGSFVEDVDMKQVANECIGMLNLGNTRENFRLITEMEDFPPIRAQRVKIMQIILNLLKNALDSVNSLPPESPKEIDIRLFQSEKDIIFSVRDSGQGIAKENIHKIFGHGFTTKKNGHGFGLHFCANAARELGGSLKVESPGELMGATFILRLPQKR
jgi:C4-dicarboxylate-specific signal transduction histidine kinase